MATKRPSKLSPSTNFKQFFFRGLAILLPTVLTIWILLAAYQFVQSRIAQPINQGVKTLVILAAPWPRVVPRDIQEVRRAVNADRGLRRAYHQADSPEAWLHRRARRGKLQQWWEDHAMLMDLIGLVLGIVLIYMVGVVLGSYIGRRIYTRGERLINRLPLIRRVYPSVKQVTDFFVGDHPDKERFSRVVAVEYPRKGIWSVGLVTGDTMRSIEAHAREECLTIFVPSSPTPFTGYVVTALRRDTIDLPLTVEDALKFAVSAGVLIPPSQKIDAPLAPSAPAGQGATHESPSF